MERRLAMHLTSAEEAKHASGEAADSVEEDEKRKGGGRRGGSANRRGRPQLRSRRNEHGGVYVDEDELARAFRFFDEDDKGHLTKQDLKDKLPLFYKNVKPKEYNYLMNKRQKLTFAELHAMLSQNELQDFDPVAEAFKIYDPENKGYIELHVIAKLLVDLGVGPVTPEDLEILLKTSDADGDGVIGLEDFRALLDANTDESILRL